VNDGPYYDYRMEYDICNNFLFN